MSEVSVTGFMGYLDLAAGVPDPQTGRAVINVIGSSTYLQLAFGDNLICIRPMMLPVSAAGIVDCNGGSNLGTITRQDHRLGTVGMGGFTAGACAVAGGSIEDPQVFQNFHSGVCNGPLEIGPGNAPDSGAGAVAIGPDQSLGTQGLPAQLTFETGSTCSGQPPVINAVVALISSGSRTEILHVNNSGSTLTYDNPGENFSCPAWTQEDGPGKLILTFPSLHGAIDGSDLINVFVFDD
jgi:hypothetical protein